jgi:hypothetical protein
MILRSSLTEQPNQPLATKCFRSAQLGVHRSRLSGCFTRSFVSTAGGPVTLSLGGEDWLVINCSRSGSRSTRKEYT